MVAAIAAATLPSRRAVAFDLEGHEIIEATAYKRLLALDSVPGAGTAGLSGRALLASLMATGVLVRPLCFPGVRGGDCGPRQRLSLPLQYWPPLRSGAPDLVMDRQISQRGQCQHFMARTADGLSPIDPRDGVPRELAAPAYDRCVRVLGLVFDGILRDPALANWRVAGTYALMHGIEDSFSAAHANRAADGRIVHLLSWTLIDWPVYLFKGRFHFPATTHHAVSDPRDKEYLRWDARAHDGRPCGDLHNPYAVPEECLSDRALAAAGAVVDYLVLLYRLRASALAEGRQPTLWGPSPEPGALWLAFLRVHVASVTAPAALPDGPLEAPPRPDLFLGLQAALGPGAWGVGVWSARLQVGPALPFVLAPTLAAGYAHDDGGGHLVGSAGMALMLPLVRRFTIGATPGAARVICNGRFQGCQVDAVARLGELLIPVGQSAWVGLEGPGWSWTERRITDARVGLAFGWSQERVQRPPAAPADAVADWNPPRPDEVRDYRITRSTRVIYLAATAASRPDNQFAGVGFDWRRDRDVWNRRAGFGPGVTVEVDAGSIDGQARGGVVAVAPTARLYLIADRLALTATPALVRVGALAGKALAVDVAARAGLAFDFGRLELGADSPALSYVARSRWYARPFTVRLGIWFD